MSPGDAAQDELRALLAALPSDVEPGPEGYEVGACLRALLELRARPEVPSPLGRALARAAGIGDQEDDDNVLWRALAALGVERGPQLRILSRPKDEGPTPALKDAMWGGLGPMHRYDLDARGDEARARSEAALDDFVEALTRFGADAETITLIVTTPLGNRGLLPRVAARLRLGDRDQRLLVVFYSGQYNVRGAHEDIARLAGDARVTIVDVSRYSFFGGQETPTDNMWRVHEACRGFDALCERANPELAQRSRAFRAHFNRELLRPTIVFDRERPPPADTRARAQALWNASESAPDPATAAARFAEYRALLGRPEVLARLKSWKRSTVIGFERDAPVADACVALLVVLLRRAPDELELIAGDWRYNGRFSELVASARPQTPALAARVRAPRRWIYQVFIGLLAAARCLRSLDAPG